MLVVWLVISEEPELSLTPLYHVLATKLHLLAQCGLPNGRHGFRAKVS